MQIESLVEPGLYESDYAAWLKRQAALARARKARMLDLANIAEELEDMGRSERRALESQLTRLLRHLLKWKFQPKRRTGSWHLTIRDARREIERILRDSPSLEPYLDVVYDECYANSRGDAAAEARLPVAVFPSAAPFSRREAITPDFLPD